MLADIIKRANTPEYYKMIRELPNNCFLDLTNTKLMRGNDDDASRHFVLLKFAQPLSQGTLSIEGEAAFAISLFKVYHVQGNEMPFAYLFEVPIHYDLEIKANMLITRHRKRPRERVKKMLSNKHLNIFTDDSRAAIAVLNPENPVYVNLKV